MTLSTTTKDSRLTTVIKVVLFLATMLSVGVAIYVLRQNGFAFALAYLLGAASLLLICAGLLFKSTGAQCVIACMGIALVCTGVWFFPPWDAVPHDPEITHTFTAPGYKVSLASEDSCYWFNGPKGQSYLCDLVVEKLVPQESAQPASATQADTAPPAQVTTEPAAAKAG